MFERSGTTDDNEKLPSLREWCTKVLEMLTHEHELFYQGEPNQMIETHTATQKKDMRDSLELVGKIVTSCSESKGSDVVVLELDPSGSVADYFIIVSGRSDRQVQGISNRIVEDLSQSGVKPYAVEGMEQGHWVILDFGDAIVHVFYGPDRERYDLEGLWTRAGRYVVDESADGVRLRAA